MSKISIDVLQADRGDCILVSCKGDNITNILIDLGVEDTYTSCAQSRLEELQCRGESLDLLILTHVDDDHIGGVLPFLKDNETKFSNKINVKDIWLNTYRHLSHERFNGLNTQRVKDSINRKVSSLTDSEDTKVSAEDGTHVAGMLYKFNYPWNVAFGGQAVKANLNSIYINTEVKITILTPTIEQLNKLQEVWLYELKRMFPDIIKNDEDILDDAILYVTHLLEEEGIPDDVEPVSSEAIDVKDGRFSEDRSVINASSITFILEYKNKRILFLADSQPSIVLQQLHALFPGISPENPLHFDAVKVAHHGSKRNTSSELMKHVSSSRFIFSTCGGRYGHPHVETISRILIYSSCKSTRKLYFNYETDIYRSFQNEELMIKYNYTCHLVDAPICIS